MIFALPFYRIEVLRQIRSPYTLAFTLAMPVAMYLLFGANGFSPDASVGHGNVAFYVMASMAAFGAATAMSSMCSLAASEAGQGWGRQLALTPLSVLGYAVVKISTALSFAAFSTAVVFVVGANTGAKADDLWRWVATVAIVLRGSLMFGLFGLGIGLLVNSDSGAALASISVSFFGFLGNVFMPLEGVMLQIAHFTPMYGYAALVRWPVTGGKLVSGDSDELWAMLLSVVLWTIVFASITYLGVLRSRARR